MEHNLNKKELVYCSTDYNNEKFKTLSIFCMEKDLRLVLILPTCQQYSPTINDCFNILGDDLLIYEIGMGMGSNLKATAQRYVAYHKNSSLYE